MWLCHVVVVIAPINGLFADEVAVILQERNSFLTHVE